jgi:hypothetical protein
MRRLVWRKGLRARAQTAGCRARSPTPDVRIFRPGVGRHRQCRDPFLLELLDRPDDLNRWSKKAVREVDRSEGRSASARNFLIGSFERRSASAVRARCSRAPRGAVIGSGGRASPSQGSGGLFRLDDGAVVDGAQFVQRSVADGFMQIASTQAGARRRVVTRWWIQFGTCGWPCRPRTALPTTHVRSCNAPRRSLLPTHRR